MLQMLQLHEWPVLSSKGCLFRTSMEDLKNWDVLISVIRRVLCNAASMLMLMKPSSPFLHKLQLCCSCVFLFTVKIKKKKNTWKCLSFKCRLLSIIFFSLIKLTHPVYSLFWQQQWINLVWNHQERNLAIFFQVAVQSLSLCSPLFSDL